MDGDVLSVQLGSCLMMGAMAMPNPDAYSRGINAKRSRAQMLDLTASRATPIPSTETY
jgi:hypothetical protein